MVTAKCVLRGMKNSPLSQSRYITEPKKSKETAADHEERCWRHRLHSNSDGNVIMPPMAFKNCLTEAARFLSIKIPGKGQKTYTKSFEAGVLVTEPLVIDVKAADVVGERMFVPSDGVKGGGKRVEKIFPLIPEWEGRVDFLIYDDAITEEVFRRVLTEAGRFVGLGRFRPFNGGYYGRFDVLSIEWVEEEAEALAAA